MLLHLSVVIQAERLVAGQKLRGFRGNLAASYCQKHKPGGYWEELGHILRELAPLLSLVMQQLAQY